jgi:hypothetical protein
VINNQNSELLVIRQFGNILKMLWNSLLHFFCPIESFPLDSLTEEEAVFLGYIIYDAETIPVLSVKAGKE